MNIQCVNRWFSILTLQQKRIIFDEPIDNFDSFNGYQQYADFIYNKWNNMGNIVKERLFKFFNKVK